MKKYIIPKTNKLIKQLQPYYKKYQQLESTHNRAIYQLEKEISKKLNISDIEFIFTDNEFAGIGNVDRTMQLIFAIELQTGKIQKYINPD